MSTPGDEQGPDRDGSGKRRSGAANVIEFAAGEQSGSGKGAAAAPAAQSEGSKPSRRRRGANGAAPEEDVAAPKRDAVPDAVMERFIKVGKQFYFPDGPEAFQDQGKRLVTRSENTVVIQSMVSIAQARGATEVQVSGSEFFRREAWFAARVAGLEVKGYKPTELEQERAVRAIGRRESAARGEAPEANAVETSTAARAAREPAAPELIVGRLVDHGRAPFQHRPDRAMSYYVRLETDRGEVEHWGLDLERALRQSLSRPGIGDEVGLRKLGSEPVTVRATKHDEAGREIGREAVSARRNQWSLEKREFLEERARMAAMVRDPSVSAAEASRRYPELDGSYVQLQVAQSMVEQRFKAKLHREQFMEHLRGYLAREIEQGRPLEPAPPRGRAAATEPRVHDRDYQPVR